ncbi:MAG: hypothetical protein IT176_01345 [Acidobacteria bacterium]|nr:hypothetical protein [Acidobacteriota bacterium]
MSDALFACLYRRRADGEAAAPDALAGLAQEFSPRFEQHGGDLVVVDASGLRRLIGAPRRIGEALQRAAAQREVRAHVALAGAWTAALVIARAQAGLTIVPPGGEAAALAPLPVGMLARVGSELLPLGAGRTPDRVSAAAVVETFKAWGVATLGAVAALPPADLSARLGRPGLAWQAIARGADARPLIPSLEAERFESALELEWPIDGREPLSFVLTRLLEPLSTRLERRDRSAAVLHVLLRLVTRDTVMRSLSLPAPIRDVRTLRTLALLNLDAHPLAAAVDRVQVIVDPAPARVVQHTFFARPHPTPEQVSTLLARLHALMGADRVGAAATVDSYRPGAFAMKPFEPEETGGAGEGVPLPPLRSVPPLVAALRRCRQPVPARVVLAAGRPVHLAADRGGFSGGAVRRCAGPWRTSGEWWAEGWNRDEWDVALDDGGVYRIFRDNANGRWFIDAIVD